jgi:hypothetical protein
LAVKDFPAWANESHALAVQYVYLNGKLTGASRPAHGDAPTTRRGDDSQAPALSREYLRNAEEIAAQRVVLAGYRIADLLNSIYDPEAGAIKDAH